MIKKACFLLAAALCILLFAVNASAQLNIPVANCQNVSGTYVDLDTNGTVITTANFDDANSAAQSIGFSFSFNGQNFTQFVLNTNGFIRLGASPPSAANLFYTTATGSVGGVFNSSIDFNIISAFNHDLTGGTNPEYRVHTSGTAPNRQCVIQFKNVRDKTSSPSEQFSSMNFQIILNESSNIVDIVYGAIAPTTNTDAFKTAGVGIKGSGTAAGQLITVTKGSVTIWSAATFLSGNYSGNAFNFRRSVLADPGRTLRFIPVKPNDLAVIEAYTLGKAPIPFGNPLTITALVKNVGTNAMLATACTLQITGANLFTSGLVVPALLPGDSIMLSFAPFSPTLAGMNNISVSLPGDDNPLNNIKTKILETNLNSYSYAQGPMPAGGVGFTNATGDFVAKFTTNSAQSVNQVDVNFATGGQPFQIGIWKAHPTTGAPDSLLHTTSTHTSSVGVYTVLINPPVSIPAGNFFVGVRQTGTTNVSFAYQSEIPIRASTFYYTSPTGGTTWTDFAPNSPFRFMVEPKFALQNDVGITAAVPSSGMTLVAGTPYALKAVVVNYGISSQNNIPVRYSVNNGTPVGPIATSSSIIQNDTTSVLFTGTNAFTPAAAGTYTIKIFTGLSNDLSNQNDTITLVYNVIPAPIASFPYLQNFTNPEHWSHENVSNLWRYGITTTGASGLSNDTAAMAAFYSTPANTTAYLKSPAFNISSLTNPTLQFDLSYRTYTTEDDSLQLLFSTDGGVTFVPGNPVIYRRSGSSNPSLATTLPDTAQFFPSASAQWRKETVGLGQFSTATNLMIAFKAISDNGNNCWVDNFTIVQGTPPTVTTAAVTSIASQSAVCGGNVTLQGTSAVTKRGVCWSTSQNPTIANDTTINGSGTGVFSSTLSGLQPATTYYVKAYATNGVGTSYGNEQTFTTLTAPVIPTLTTDNASSITQTTAVSGGNVTSDGNSPVTDRGVCWSTSQNPTIANYKTTDGSGTGVFTSNLTGLVAANTYYVRAYATNAIGTAYGNEISFTTSAPVVPPTVTTTTPANVTQNSVASGGNVTADGGASVSARGVCWDSLPNPTIMKDHTTDGSGMGIFTSQVTGLNSSTTYYLRAYATNSAGTGYGTQAIFTTLINSIGEKEWVELKWRIESNTLFIRIPENIQLTGIGLFDISGRMILDAAKPEGGIEYGILLPELSSGVYLLQLRHSGGIINARIPIR